MSEQSKQSRETFEEFTPLGARRCQAHSKRSGKQCGNPAITGKDKCRMHGGKSTGAPPEKLKGNVNRATPGSPRSKYKSVQQQRIEQEKLQKLSISEIMEALARSHAAKSILATSCRENEEVDPSEDEGRDDGEEQKKIKLIDYDSVARVESMAAARLANTWATVKRVEEPSAGEGGSEGQTAVDELEDMIVDAVNEAKEREKALSQ